ncbi:hypothetical protein [Kocuria nitroreducens]|uniref:hypothetical protein n=1 Tax=Kocuria nitroreducens TaxID=3058914 RepID=UPI0036DEDAB0
MSTQEQPPTTRQNAIDSQNKKKADLQKIEEAQSKVNNQQIQDIVNTFVGEFENRVTEKQQLKDPETKSETPELCDILKYGEGPEQIVNFHQLIVAKALEVFRGDEIDGGPIPTLACNILPNTRVNFCFDLQYQQQWFFNYLKLGALSASIALAPNETLSISVRNTQITKFDRETLDEEERTEQTENSTAFNDVFNVTKSSSKTNNWTVSGNAGITLPKFSVGVSGSVTSTVNNAFSSSAQQTKNSTEKSASNLKTLHKVQVRESTETTAEDTTARKIRNPYRDRTLRIDVYNLVKEYDIQFKSTQVLPAIEITPGILRFDREFILSNGRFLAEELTDQTLAAELAEALQLTSNSPEETFGERAGQVALMALDSLFGSKPIFNFPTPWPNPSIGESGPIRPRPWDENDAQNSFIFPLESSFSAYADAVDTNFGIIYSTLASYNRVYLDQVLPGKNASLAVELAISLEAQIGPLWLPDKPEHISTVIDSNRSTEVFRRISGFLAMVKGILSPLLQPAEGEKEEKLAQQRAEWVLSRVIKHLTCHNRYYSERYIYHLAAKTRTRSIAQFAQDILVNHLPQLGKNGLTLFDPDTAFLSRDSIIVPIRVSPEAGDLANLLTTLEQDAPDVEPGILTNQTLTIPTDGVHMESSSGFCVLGEIMDSPISGPIKVVLEQE